MAPVTLQRFVEKLAKLKQGTDDARLARIIRELREQGLDADRAVATAALADALERGVEAHLQHRLGLA